MSYQKVGDGRAPDVRADGLSLQRIAPSLSIIVPTKNEAQNVLPLLKRLESAVVSEEIAAKDVEVIFVDDSEDDTPAKIEEAGLQFSFAITSIVRPRERRNGLGMAVVEGMQIARGTWVVVMDGDLQHPPELIPQLLQKARSTEADLVAGSRLAEGGSADSLGWRRKLLSHALAQFSRFIFPKNLRSITDPLTGFFLFRRSAVNPDYLRPKGFKILLEILVRCPKLKVAEVPFEFGQRLSGKSKASPREMIALLEQMAGLRFAPHEHLFRFLMVGLSGLVVNTLLMFVLVDFLGFHYVLGAIAATQGSTLWNFEWTERWVFGNRELPGRRLWVRMLSFFVVNNSMLLLRGPMLIFFVASLGMHHLLGNFVSLVVMTALRFLIADRFIWGSGSKSRQDIYYYNIHDIIRVRSMRRLPELRYFTVSEAIAEPDIDVIVTPNLDGYLSDKSIAYEEMLGSLGFSIVINQKETRTDVIASPLVGMSPHVLYTNVVEPLLRWNFVRKGYALMHGACLAIDGKALFVTARTDTGKTTTILQTMRNNLDKVTFLSDDMTIVSRDGRVMNYPKPLTISLHTLRAVTEAPLTISQRLFLQVQSRLHSRGGRKAGLWLSHNSVPAATLNAIVQKLIPPPKYMIDELIPRARHTSEAQLSHVVLIERGPDFEATLDEIEKARVLVENAEDAYGFPPYPTLAHALCHWNGIDLHESEAEIVTAATQNLPAIHLRSPRFDWYRRLPHFLQEPVIELPTKSEVLDWPAPGLRPSGSA